MIRLALFYSQFVLRPEPGSRVKLISAHTQGAGVPLIGAPVKGNSTHCTTVSVTAAHLQVGASAKRPEHGICNPTRLSDSAAHTDENTHVREMSVKGDENFED